MNLASAFARSSGEHGPKVALFWGEAEYSYTGLLDQTLRLSRFLGEDCHLKPRARVGLWLKNCPEFVSCLFAVWFVEGVVVPINNFLKANEVAFILADGGIDLLISEEGLSHAFAELQAGRPSLRVLKIEALEQLLRPNGLAPIVPPQTQDDLAVIIYTSGTTGHPKGAMLSHGNLLHNVESCRKVLHAVSYDRIVVILPMFHSFMLTVGILLPLRVGGSMVLVKAMQSPKSMLEEAMKRQATLLPAIPQFFRAMAHAQLPERTSLRLCVSGAAPLPGEILKEFHEKVPIPLLEGYGLSEASPVVSINPIEGPWKAGSIGVPIPDVEMSVQNDQGEHLPSGQIGEICVRGGNVMQGYWNQPLETANALRDGWLLTGDVGYRDADGYYFITDRKKDMLLVNGINVYPREIEEVIYQFAGIREAAVIGIPDARKGEQPLAFVALNEGAHLEEKDLLQFVKDKLADYKVPKRVVVLPALPRNATGKVLKKTLRQMA